MTPSPQLETPSPQAEKTPWPQAETPSPQEEMIPSPQEMIPTPQEMIPSPQEEPPSPQEEMIPSPQEETTPWPQIVPLSGDKPFFTIVLSKGHVEKPVQLVCIEEIPSRLHSHLPGSRVPAVLQFGNQSWAVTYCGELKCKKLGPGWRDFVVANRLRIGDGCVFELITLAAGGTGSEGDGKVVFRVQVLRGDLPEEITSRGATSQDPIVIVDN
ncbi:B3 domain-containing protein Os06g0112300-like [Panicum virgatum]|uniref:B3 domain-containing protein Os06g0112300-like n=1 Tax=Panicum virgatum TaxID=38727 RepID=UPI0019D655A7|nr:B3 domain-containing protein Os06g0112300-like [Panicum virgatum]